MTSWKFPRWAVFSLLAPGAIACTKQPRTFTASSANQATYALGYDDSLSAARSEEAALESQIDAATTAFPQYPDALSGPNWSDVLVVYTAADDAGRSTDYVDELQKDQGVAQFYVDEKDEMNRRIGGAAQYAAKQKECDVELSGPTSYALSKAFEEGIRDRLHKHSDAYLYISDHEETLLKKNRPKLEDQSDAISQTSYFVRVGAPELRDKLAREVSESSKVQDTLDKIAEDAHRVATDGAQSSAVRGRAAERERVAIAAKQRIASEASESKKLADDMDKRIDALTEKYDSAFKALIKDVKARQNAH